MKKVVGYKKRPWWIISFSLFFTFLPFLALALKLQQQEPSQLLSWPIWKELISHFELNNWLLVFLSVSIGFLIYRVTKTSLILVSVLFLLILVLNLMLLKKIVIWAIILPIIFWFSSFRKPYLNRALRWWEQLPRFWIQEDQDLILVDRKRGRIINLSLSGVLIEPLEESFSYNLEESALLSLADIELPAKLKRHSNNQFGFQFAKLSLAHKRKLKTFLRAYRRELPRS